MRSLIKSTADRVTRRQDGWGFVDNAQGVFPTTLQPQQKAWFSLLRLVPIDQRLVPWRLLDKLAASKAGKACGRLGPSRLSFEDVPPVFDAATWRLAMACSRRFRS